MDATSVQTRNFTDQVQNSTPHISGVTILIILIYGVIVSELISFCVQKKIDFVMLFGTEKF